MLCQITCVTHNSLSSQTVGAKEKGDTFLRFSMKVIPLYLWTLEYVTHRDGLLPDGETPAADTQQHVREERRPLDCQQRPIMHRVVEVRLRGYTRVEETCGVIKWDVRIKVGGCGIITYIFIIKWIFHTQMRTKHLENLTKMTNSLKNSIFSTQ